MPFNSITWLIPRAQDAQLRPAGWLAALVEEKEGEGEFYNCAFCANLRAGQSNDA